MWQTLLFQPLLNALILFYRLFGNLGWAVVFMTLALRLLLWPLTQPSLKSAQKIKDLEPELAILKKKYAHDKQALAQAQMALYREKGLNPAAGCLPQLIQLVVLIAFYQAFNQVLQGGDQVIAELNRSLYPSLRLAEDAVLVTRFWYLDLVKPDIFTVGGLKLPGLFLILAAVSQFLSSWLTAPSLRQSQKVAAKTAGETDDFAVMMQKEMVFLFPLMTLLLGLNFPSGLVLYWLIFSVSTLVQQLLVVKKPKA